MSRFVGTEIVFTEQKFCKNGHDLSITRAVCSDGKTRCYDCLLKRVKSFDKANPEKRKSYRLKHRYGITLVEYNNMLAEQNGECAICHEKDKLYIDHDHKDGQVRGLLCSNCNSGLGMFKDNLEGLSKAVEYLKRAAERKSRGGRRD